MSEVILRWGYETWAVRKLERAVSGNCDTAAVGTVSATIEDPRDRGPRGTCAGFRVQGAGCRVEG